MSDARTLGDVSQRLVAAGEWWVLLVTDGFTVELAPELYRNQNRAEREGDRWAHLLSVRTGDAIERPFEGRWEIGDHWVRLVDSFLPEEGPEIWVGTYWGRDGSPEPEAALFAAVADARAWALEPAPGRLAYETHETPWSIAVTYKVRGGDEEAEVHRGKVIAELQETSEVQAPAATLYGFEVSEGLIPQGPVLFLSRIERNAELRRLLERELAHREWPDLVQATASGNYVDDELPLGWQDSWDPGQAIEWLTGFDFIGNGDDFEIRSFETGVS